jgi:putative ABC transport system permease protein
MLNWGPPITAEVVGVAGDVVGQDPEAPINPTIYWHYPQFPQIFTLSLVVRTARDEAAIVPEIRQAIWDLEPNQPLPRIEPMRAAIAAARAQRTTVTGMLVALAVTAAVFALVGLYGVLSHKAARDVPAHGVRLALGARGVDVGRLVVGDAMRVVCAGILLGAVVAWLGGRAIESLLFQTAAGDLPTFIIAAVLLVAAALAAALGPAWRASRVDPALTLKEM